MDGMAILAIIGGVALLAVIILLLRRRTKRAASSATYADGPDLFEPRPDALDLPRARPAPIAPPAPAPAPAPPEPQPTPSTSANVDDAGPEAEDHLRDALTLEATAPGDDFQAPAEAPGEAATAEPVRFSAYYPKEAAPSVWLPLRAYVYRLNAAEAVAKDAADALKDTLSDYRPVAGDALVPLAEGALITATPELPGFQFNPPSASIALYEDWHAFSFKLRAESATVEQATNGRITFTVEGVIVADLPLSIFVTPGATQAVALPAHAAADPYDAIFCSYSHRDAAIVERLERACKALGLDYLRDVTTLRSGEEWNPRLLALIDEADIFQLFWSSAAAQSRYVRQEWEHALSLGRGGAFIRPVYWEQPMPKAPEELGRLHFHFDAALADLR